MKRVLLSYFVMSFFLLSVAFAQNKAITGKVTSATDGTSLPGVSVTVKGNAKVGTQTDTNGNFKLSVPADSKTLVFGYIGFKGLESPISNVVNVKLEEDQKSLTEVVVVGYGTQNKRDLTGSVSRVTSKEFADQPISTFESALQGRAAGVFINSGSGKLGQGLTIRVRGISSISAGQDPLYVIDGQPVVSQALGSATEPDNPLASIAPEDIESIEILKDAAAASIYGARASNGVVLVTTKSGKAGKTKVNFTYFTGVSSPTYRGDFMNAAEYRQIFTDAIKNSSLNGVLWNRDDPEDAWLEFGAGTDDWSKNYDTKWTDLSFQDGGISQYNISVNGGDAKTRFFISGGYNDQTGILIGNSFNRSNGRLNVDHSVSDKFKIGTNISVAKTINNRVSSDNAFTNPLQLNAIPPIQRARLDDGELSNETLYYNNLIDLEKATAISSQLRSISNFNAKYNFTSSLSLTGDFGFDITQLDEENYNGKETLDGAPSGLGFTRQVNSSSYNTNTYLSYLKSFGKHNIDLVGGTSFQTTTLKTGSSTGIGFPNDKFTKIASAAIVSGGSSTETGYSFLSYFARGNYKFADKYIIGASGRIDGSSRFGSNNRYGFFPSVSAGWIITEENFLKSIPKISLLKLRASYGLTGNSEIGNFPSLTLYSALPYADKAGIVPSQIGVDDLRWEKSKKLDIGLEFGFFNNRISGEFDYFDNQTEDLLLSFPLPATNGFTSIVRNVGKLENKGFEFTLNTNNLVGKFKWSTSFNISTYKNKILSTDGSIINGGARQLGRIAEGNPYGYFYGPKYAGVDPANGDAIYFNEDGTTANESNWDGFEQQVGDPNPEFYGGFGNTFSYKGLDLNIQTQFVYGNDLYNIAGFFQSVNGDYYDNQTRDQLNYWTPTNTITNIPQPRFIDGNGAFKSSRWVQDGSYFRVKSVVLGYRIPANILSKLKVDNARIYVSGQNLLTFTNYDGYDPEVNATYTGRVNLGHDFYTPPQARTITFGVNFGF
jgi:TonB-linked SusC/RagA family outer membrane protein